MGAVRHPDKLLTLTIIIIMEYMTIGRYGPIVHNSFNSLSGMRQTQHNYQLQCGIRCEEFVEAN